MFFIGHDGDLCHVDDPQVPSIPVRLSLVKLFLELSLFNPALLTLQGIMASDDQEVEAWYLEGWAFYLMAELARDSPSGKLEGEGLAWEELAKDARDCLETCKHVSLLKRHFLLGECSPLQTSCTWLKNTKMARYWNT